MRKQPFLLSVLAVCSLLFSACTVGLNKNSRAKFAEIKVQFVEVNHNLSGFKEGIEDLNEKLDTLNKNLVDLKTILSANMDKLNPAELVATLKRIAGALEALNIKAGKVLGD